MLSSDGYLNIAEISYKIANMLTVNDEEYNNCLLNIIKQLLKMDYHDEACELIDNILGIGMGIKYDRPGNEDAVEYMNAFTSKSEILKKLFEMLETCKNYDEEYFDKLRYYYEKYLHTDKWLENMIKGNSFEKEISAKQTADCWRLSDKVMNSKYINDINAFDKGIYDDIYSVIVEEVGVDTLLCIIPLDDIRERCNNDSEARDKIARWIKWNFDNEEDVDFLMKELCGIKPLSEEDKIHDQILKERERNRISVASAKYIADKLGVGDRVTFLSGHIGLEDMTFDTMYIDDKMCGEPFMHDSHAWYNNRMFGDNKMSFDFFKNCLEKNLGINVDNFFNEL